MDLDNLDTDPPEHSSKFTMLKRDLMNNASDNSIAKMRVQFYQNYHLSPFLYILFFYLSLVGEILPKVGGLVSIIWGKTVGNIIGGIEGRPPRPKNRYYCIKNIVKLIFMATKKKKIVKLGRAGWNAKLIPT